MQCLRAAEPNGRPREHHQTSCTTGGRRTRPSISKGFDAIWTDETEPDIPPKGSYYYSGPGTEYFNVYPLFETTAVYHGMRSDTRQRAMILARAAFTGAQSNAAIFWSSDISPTWDTLQRQVPAGLDVTASGIPYWTDDASHRGVRLYREKPLDPLFRPESVLTAIPKKKCQRFQAERLGVRLKEFRDDPAVDQRLSTAVGRPHALPSTARTRYFQAVTNRFKYGISVLMTIGAACQPIAKPGENLRIARKRRGLRIADLAQAAGRGRALLPEESVSAEGFWKEKRERQAASHSRVARGDIPQSALFAFGAEHLRGAEFNWPKDGFSALEDDDDVEERPPGQNMQQVPALARRHPCVTSSCSCVGD